MIYLWFLKFHRWLALAFGLPLLIITVTGVIVTFDPWLTTRAISPGRVTPALVDQLLAQHDPEGQARALIYRSYDHSFSLRGPGGEKVVDAATLAPLPAPSGLATLLFQARMIHERLLFGLDWLVPLSSAVMLIILVLGLLMRWPPLRMSVAGWHLAIGLGLFPLAFLSAATGLMMAMGITLNGLPPAGPPHPGPLPSLRQAAALAGQQHDLSALTFLRRQGNRMLLRLDEGGDFTLHLVTADGVTRLPENWPRAWHEGTFAGGWPVAMNLLLSLALTGLMASGLWIWGQRAWRRRMQRLNAAGLT